MYNVLCSHAVFEKLGLSTSGSVSGNAEALSQAITESEFEDTYAHVYVCTGAHELPEGLFGRLIGSWYV